MNTINTNFRVSKQFFLTLTLIFILLFISQSVFAEVECPFGLVNDTAPGQCMQYVDASGNEICDLSEPHNCTTEITTNNPLGTELSGTELKTMTVKEVAKLYGIDSELFATELGKSINIKVVSTDSLQLLHDNNGLGMSVVKEIAASLASKSSANSVVTQAVPITTNSFPERQKTSYNLIPLVLITAILYFTTFILAKKDVFTIITHRKIWNWVLLAVFLVMAVLSIILVINRDYSPGIRLPINTTFWHVETGIVMVVISLFHIWWHLRYYFPKKKSATIKNSE